LVPFEYPVILVGGPLDAPSLPIVVPALSKLIMTMTSVISPVVPDTNLRQLIQDCYNVGATVLYLQIGRSPFYRLYGKLLSQDQHPIVTPDRYSQYVQELLPSGLLGQLRTHNSGRSIPEFK
jgi:hypothetical protein